MDPQIKPVAGRMFALVGMKHRGTEQFVRDLPTGEPLMLVREYGNRFDARAVQVWAREKHVGYIAAKQNKDLSMAMDACASEPGQPVSWTERAVLHNQNGKWPLVEVAEEPK